MKLYLNEADLKYELNITGSNAIAEFHRQSANESIHW